MVCYRSSSSQADITFDADRFATLCQDYLERVGSWRPGLLTNLFVN
jgi:hypothetical protein